MTVQLSNESKQAIQDALDAAQAAAEKDTAHAVSVQELQAATTKEAGAQSDSLTAHKDAVAKLTVALQKLQAEAERLANAASTPTPPTAV